MVKGFYLEKSGVAFEKLKRNLMLLLPDIAYLIYFSIFGLLFLYVNNFFGFGGEGIKEYAMRLLSELPSLIKVIVSFLVLIIINIWFGVTMLSIRYTYIEKVIRGEKIKFGALLKEASRNIKGLFFLKFWLILILLVPSLVSLLLLLYVPYLGVGAIIFSSLYWIIVGFVFMYAYPILFLEKGKKSAIKTVFKAISYTKRNFKHCLRTAFMLIFVFFIVGLFVALVPSVWVGILEKIGYKGYIVVPVILYLVFRFIVNLGLKLWKDLFLFESYLKFKP